MKVPFASSVLPAIAVWCVWASISPLGTSAQSNSLVRAANSTNSLGFEDEELEFGEPCDCHPRRETLTGDWFHARKHLEHRGIEFDGTVTQFLQGATNGGIERRLRYGGHGDYDMVIDFEKLCCLEGLKLELGAEHRFGTTASRDTGSAIPVALLLELPKRDTDHLALTTVVLQYEVMDQVQLFAGKLDTLKYDTNEFADGKGRERFFSTAFNYNPIATRTIPFSALGAGVNINREDGERFFTFVVINPEETATTVGISELFAEGVSMFGELRLPVEVLGRRGHQMFGASWSSREFVSLSQTGRVDFPDIPIARKEGSWAVFWNADQYLWQDPCDSSRGWGLFGRAGISDGNPNPISWFLSLGIGGRGIFEGRDGDTFGVGWYYTGISDELGPVVSRLLRDGQGVELFYEFEITEWVHLAPDLQVVVPNISGVDTSLVAGLRLRIEL